MNMSYLRVIPRDLFNEASLLKCYGKLYLETEGNPDATFGDSDFNSFDVEQREDDGYLFISNLPFKIGCYQYRLVRPLNSRESWPLYAERIGDSHFECVPVFDANGNLSCEMLGLLRPVLLRTQNES